MQDGKPLSLEQIREFLKASDQIHFKGRGRAEIYAELAGDHFNGLFQVRDDFRTGRTNDVFNKRRQDNDVGVEIERLAVQAVYAFVRIDRAIGMNSLHRAFGRADVALSPAMPAALEPFEHPYPCRNG